MSAPVLPVVVEPPPPGHAVMRCRCGRMLDLRHMHRLIPPRDTAQGSAALRPIVCLACAATTTNGDQL